MINVLCHFPGRLGVQRLGRHFVMALRRHDDIALLPIERPTLWIQRSPAVRQMLRNARGPLEGNIGLAIGAPDLAPRIVGQPRVIHTVWETTKIPAPVLEHLESADQVWTPSRWGKGILLANGIPAEKVRVVPEGVDPQRFRPANLPLRSRRFRFLCVGKWEARKGVVYPRSRLRGNLPRPGTGRAGAALSQSAPARLPPRRRTSTLPSRRSGPREPPDPVRTPAPAVQLVRCFRPANPRRGLGLADHGGHGVCQAGNCHRLQRSPGVPDGRELLSDTGRRDDGCRRPSRVLPFRGRLRSMGRT